MEKRDCRKAITADGFLILKNAVQHCPHVKTGKRAFCSVRCPGLIMNMDKDGGVANVSLACFPNSISYTDVKLLAENLSDVIESGYLLPVAGA